MLKEGIYTLSELTAYLTERTQKNEFNPKKGPKVDSEDVKNNREAVRKIMNDTEKHSGVKVPERNNNGGNTVDYNCTTIEYRFDAEPDERYKERVKAQVHGYPSPENEKNSDVEKSGAETKGGKEYYKTRKKVSDDREEMRKKEKHSGLKSRMRPEKDFESKTAFKNESKTMKRLHFKNTCFLSEAQMFSRIPEEYKTDGNVFIMRDATGTDYLVECRVDDTYGCKNLRVVNKMNKQSVNEELDRMRGLYEYRSDANGAVENKEMSDMLRGVRELGSK